MSAEKIAALVAVLIFGCYVIWAVIQTLSEPKKGKDMGRVKTCRVCGEVLFCKECGERQTPTAPDWQKKLIQLTPEQKVKVEKEAEEKGISINEVIRRRIDGDENC